MRVSMLARYERGSLSNSVTEPPRYNVLPARASAWTEPLTVGRQLRSSLPSERRWATRSCSIVAHALDVAATNQPPAPSGTASLTDPATKCGTGATVPAASTGAQEPVRAAYEREIAAEVDIGWKP